MVILTFIEKPIRVFTLSKSFSFLIPFMASEDPGYSASLITELLCA